MRLLVASSWGPVPAVNGARQRAHAILTHLAARHDIALVTFAEADDVSAVRAWGRQFASCQVIEGNPHKPRRPLRTRDLFSPVPRSYALTWDPAMEAAVAFALPSADAAVALEIGTAAYVAARVDRPRVFEEAEVAAIEGQRRQATSWHARLRRELTWRKYARYTVGLTRAFDMTTVVSGAERDLLLGWGAEPDAVAVVGNGIDPRAFAVRRTREAHTLVYPGAMTFAANREAVAWFVQGAWPRIRARCHDARLIVTGDTTGVDLAPLRAPGVEFAGYVDDIQSVVAERAAVVVPLLSGGGTRLKVLEAFALETPVIGTSKGVEGLGVVDGVHARVADAPETFAEAVIDVFTHPDLAQARAARARQEIADPAAWPLVLAGLDAAIETARERWARRQRS